MDSIEQGTRHHGDPHRVGRTSRLDPITLEIIRHRLWSIADEMAMTLIRTAGNPTITEAHDFIVALFTPAGDLAMGGWGANRHVSCTAVACRGILARFSLSDIHEDDVFLLNDPYVAAIHQQDVYVISPIHFGGALIGWTVNFTHLPDIGGIDPGWSSRATEVTQEGLRIPGLKIVDRGLLRQDVWDTLLNMTREPEMNALQLRAQMAANHTGKEKIRGLVQKIGVETYQAVLAELIAQSEQALRTRLRTLPDGTWRTREYFDTKDRIFKIELAMTKKEDRLDFDFTGTSEQAKSFINCTYWGARGGIFVSVSSMLAFGLAWNEGLLKPLSLTVPEGTLLNCTFPAPVSMGTVAASRLATIASWDTVASMLAMSDDFKDEFSTLWSSSSTGTNFSGFNRENRYFVLSPFANAGGGGARRLADGIDSGGSSNNLMASNSNIETLERNGPVLYLYRRHLTDSGGPGIRRGGASTEIAMTVHKAPRGVVQGLVYGSGLEPAQTHGLFGGFPAGNTLFELHEGTTVQQSLAKGGTLQVNKLGGKATRLPPQGLFEMDRDGVFCLRSDGGGGLGDPLLRRPGSVLADVRAGLASPVQARDIYGVILDEARNKVDEEATIRLRSEIRTERLGYKPPRDAARAVKSPESAIPSVVLNRATGTVDCALCHYELSALNESWKGRSVERSTPLAALGSLMVSTQFVLRTFICPGCATILDAEMTLPSDPPVHSYSP
jgi:N-methylhydantoinase B